MYARAFNGGLQAEPSRALEPAARPDCDGELSRMARRCLLLDSFARTCVLLAGMSRRGGVAKGVVAAGISPAEGHNGLRGRRPALGLRARPASG